MRNTQTCADGPFCLIQVNSATTVGLVVGGRPADLERQADVILRASGHLAPVSEGTDLVLLGDRVWELPADVPEPPRAVDPAVQRAVRLALGELRAECELEHLVITLAVGLDPRGHRPPEQIAMMLRLSLVDVGSLVYSALRRLRRLLDRRLGVTLASGTGPQSSQAVAADTSDLTSGDGPTHDWDQQGRLQDA